MKKQMKTAFMGVFTALLGVVIFAGMSLTAFAYEGTAKDKVNVRDAAVTGTPVGSLTAGQKVEIKGESTDGTGQVWYQIEFNGGTGYVRGDYITTDGGGNGGGDAAAATSDSSDSDVTSTPEMDAKVANTDQVNVRRGAGTNFPQIGQLAQGTEVKVTGEANDDTGMKWYRVRFNGTEEGYIRNDFLEVDESSAVAATTEEDPEEAAGGASTVETPVTEDPGAGTNPGGTMGQQYTVAYMNDEAGATGVPFLIDNNSSSRWEVTKLLDSFNEVATLKSQAKQGGVLKIVCIVLAVLCVLAFVGLGIVIMRYRKEMEGGDPSYDDDDDYDDEDDDYGDEEDDYDDEEDDYDDAPKKKKGGLFSKFKKNRRNDYDDEEDDEDYDDEDDDYDDEEPRSAIGRVYSPEPKKQSSYDDDYNRPSSGGGRVVTPNRNATKRPRNFMEEDDDDFEYGFLGDDDDDM